MIHRLQQIALFLIWSASFTEAATYYVTKAGSDRNSCGLAKNELTAKSTIGGGIGCLSSGDTLVIAAGVYGEVIDNTIPSGSSGNPTIIRARLGDRVTLKPPADLGKYGDVIRLSDDSYVTIWDLIVDATNASTTGIRLAGSSGNNLIQGCTIQNARLDGIFLQDSGSKNNTIRSCVIRSIGTTNQHHGVYIRSSENAIEDSEFYQIAGYGVVGYSSSQNVSSNTIRRNLFRDSMVERGGILVGCNPPFSANSNKIYNNVIHHNLRAIELYDFGDGNKVWNNTVYNNGIYGILIDANQKNAEVRNNILSGHPVPIGDLGTGTQKSDNLFDDPLFADILQKNVGAYQFRLTP